MGSIDWLPIETFDGRSEPVLLWCRDLTLNGDGPLTGEFVDGEWQLMADGPHSTDSTLCYSMTHWAAIDPPSEVVRHGDLLALGPEPGRVTIIGRTATVSGGFICASGNFATEDCTSTSHLSRTKGP